jgi:hypothetical protein
VRWEVDGTGSGSCPVAGFVISGVEPAGSETMDFKWPVKGKANWDDVRLGPVTTQSIYIASRRDDADCRCMKQTINSASQQLEC